MKNIVHQKFSCALLVYVYRLLLVNCIFAIFVRIKIIQNIFFFYFVYKSDPRLKQLLPTSRNIKEFTFKSLLCKRRDWGWPLMIFVLVNLKQSKYTFYLILLREDKKKVFS